MRCLPVQGPASGWEDPRQAGWRGHQVPRGVPLDLQSAAAEQGEGPFGASVDLGV
jgi:hypothetical protein